MISMIIILAGYKYTYRVCKKKNDKIIFFQLLAAIMDFVENVKLCLYCKQGKIKKFRKYFDL